MAKILGVGIAAVDIVLGIDAYPQEDSENRALWQDIRRGGNCCNTLVILSQLGHQCWWAGTCASADHIMSHTILDDLHAFGISTQYCSWYDQGSPPTSYIYLNTQNGSRSIVHYRDLPEYNSSDFENISLNDFQWVHFEARNVDQTINMMARVKETNIPISLELEKNRPGFETLLPFADVIFFSRNFALQQKFYHANQFMQSMINTIPEKIFTCTWGSEGAWFYDGNQTGHHQIEISKVDDTIGAGDTFNAAMIHQLVQGKSLSLATHWATSLASRKCGISGLDIRNLLEE